MQFVGLWKNYLCLFTSKASTFWYPQNQIWIRTFQNFSLEKLYCAIIVLFTPVLPVPLNNARHFEVGGCGRNHHAFYWKQRKQNSCISSYLVACTRFRPPSFEREPIHLNLTLKSAKRTKRTKRTMQCKTQENWHEENQPQNTWSHSSAQVVTAKMALYVTSNSGNHGLTIWIQRFWTQRGVAALNGSKVIWKCSLGTLP